MKNSTNSLSVPTKNIHSMSSGQYLLPLPTPLSSRQTLASVDNIPSILTDNDLQRVPPSFRPISSSATFGNTYPHTLSLSFSTIHSRQRSSSSLSTTTSSHSHCQPIQSHAIMARLLAHEIRAHDHGSVSDQYSLFTESLSRRHSTWTHRRLVTLLILSHIISPRFRFSWTVVGVEKVRQVQYQVAQKRRTHSQHARYYCTLILTLLYPSRPHSPHRFLSRCVSRVTISIRASQALHSTTTIHHQLLSSYSHVANLISTLNNNGGGGGNRGSIFIVVGPFASIQSTETSMYHPRLCHHL